MNSYTKEEILEKQRAFVKRFNLRAEPSDLFFADMICSHDDAWDCIGAFEMYIYSKIDFSEVRERHDLMHGCGNLTRFIFDTGVGLLIDFIEKGHDDEALNVNMERLWNEHRDLVFMFIALYVVDFDAKTQPNKLAILMKTTNSGLLAHLFFKDRKFMPFHLAYNALRGEQMTLLLIYSNFIVYQTSANKGVNDPAAFAHDMRGSIRQVPWRHTNTHQSFCAAHVYRIITCLDEKAGVENDYILAIVNDLAYVRCPDFFDIVLFPHGIHRLPMASLTKKALIEIYCVADSMRPLRRARARAFALRGLIDGPYRSPVSSADVANYKRFMELQRATLRVLTPSFRALLMAYLFI